MNPFVKFLNSSIGRKYVMAITGLSLLLFLIVHLVGNLTLYVGPEAFNEYAYFLESNPLLPVAEAGLAAVFLVHIVFAIMLINKNRGSRSDKYQSSLGMGAKTLASTTMWVTGPLLLVFLLIHLWDFRISKEFIDPSEYDLAAMVIARFKSPIGLGIYVTSMVVLGFHMWHAFQSAFQTLGLAHPRYRGLIQLTGRAIAVLLVVGFGGIPCYLFFAG